MFRLVIVALLSALFGGCGETKDTSSSTSPNALFTAMKDTVPAFNSGSGFISSKKPSASAISDATMGMAFKVFRNFNSSTDEGVVDMSSFHKVMNEVGRYLDDAPTFCTTIASALDSSLSPFAFGSEFLGHSYTCGGNSSRQTGYETSAAYNVSGTVKQALITFKQAPNPSEESAIGAFQVSWDSSSNDITINFALAVNKPSSSGFGLRTQIIGNTASHSFTIRAINNSDTLVGKGISQGSGSYFLIKSGTNYYCIAAGATENDLAAISPVAGGSLSSNCTAYKAAVDALTAYDSATAQVNSAALR